MLHRHVHARRVDAVHVARVVEVPDHGVVDLQIEGIAFAVAEREGPFRAVRPVAPEPALVADGASRAVADGI